MDRRSHEQPDPPLPPVAEQRVWVRVVEEAACGIAVSRAVSDRIEFVNATFARMHRCTKEQLSGKPIADIFAPDDRLLFPDRLRLIHECGSLRFEAMRLRADGTVFPALIEVRVISGDDGGPDYRIATVIDISDLKAAEDALRQSEERRRLAMEAAHMGYWDWDVQRDTVCHSREMGPLFGRPPGDTFENYEAFLATVHPDDRPAVARAVEDALVTGARYETEFRVIWPDGSVHWLAVLGRVYHGSTGDPVRLSGVCTDVTERKRAEFLARQRLCEQAHGARLNTLGLLAAAIAHELNQPLAAIANFAEGALHRMPEGAQETGLADALDAIAGQALRAGEIIRRLRDLARRSAPRREEEDLNDLITEAAGLLQADGRFHGVSVSTDLGDRLPPVFVDKIQIQQVLVNLVHNAIDAVRELPPERRHVLIRTAQGEAGLVVVSVSDRGPGLPADAGAEQAQPFSSTKPDGMGLGLCISRAIIEAHGGRIRAANNADGGTTFQFTLAATGREPEALDP